jgi:hypothetical protein
MPTFITCNHILGEKDIIEGSEIELTFKNDEKKVILTIDKSRKIYTSDEKEYDITIIEIKHNDGIE